MARNSQMETSNTVRRSARIAAKSGGAVAETAAPVEKRNRRKQESPKKYVAPTKNRNCCEADCGVTDAEVNDFLNFINHLASVANASMQNPVQAAPPVAPRRSTRGRTVVEDVENKTLRVTTVVDETPMARPVRSTRNKNRIVMDESDVEDDNDSLYTPDAREELDDDFEMEDLVDEATLEESDVEEPEEEDEEPVKKRRKVVSGNRGDNARVHMSKELGKVLDMPSGTSFSFTRGGIRKQLFDYMEGQNLYTTNTGNIVKLNSALKTVYNHVEPNDLVVVYKVVNSILKHHTSVASNKSVKPTENSKNVKPTIVEEKTSVVYYTDATRVIPSKELCNLLNNGLSSLTKWPLSSDGKTTYKKGMLATMLFEYIELKKLSVRPSRAPCNVIQLNNELATMYKGATRYNMANQNVVINDILTHHTTMPVEKVVVEVAKPVEKVVAKPVVETAKNEKFTVSKALQKVLGKRTWENKEQVREALFQYMKDSNLYTKKKDEVRINDALRTVYDHDENKAVVYKVVNSILKHHVNAEGRGINKWLTFVHDVRERMAAISKNPASVTFRNANLLARDLYLRGYDSMKNMSDSVFLAEYNNMVANGRKNGA